MDSTPLGWAARGGHEEVVKLLLESQDVDPDILISEDDRQTPLWYVAENG